MGLTSHLHVEIDRETGLAVLEALRDEIESVVDDVFAAVADWDALAPCGHRVRRRPARRRLRPASARRRRPRSRRTSTGWPTTTSRSWARSRVDAVRGRGARLGAGCRAPASAVRPRRLRCRRPSACSRSPVRRCGPPCTATCRSTRSPCGASRPTAPAVGELRLLGLYTANVFSDGVERIPVVRQKVAEVLERSGFAPDGHDGRALEHVLATYPRDELFRLAHRRARRAGAGDRRAWGCGGGCGCS